MRAARIGAFIGILGALIAAPSVSAGGVTQTTISIHIVFKTGGADETFTTTGGLLCPSGTAVSDPFFQTIGGSQNRGNFTFHLVKTLTCDDESGTFKILVDAARTPTGTVGGFAAGRGTGDYVGLHGGGQLVGTGFNGGLDDLYTGNLTIAP